MVMVRCYRCGYEWERRGKLQSFQCPNCRKLLYLNRAIEEYNKYHPQEQEEKEKQEQEIETEG